MNLRAEKTTRNADDFRVLLAGCVLTILFMLIAPMFQQKWDQYVATRPFVQVQTLEIVKIEGESVPKILYDADSNRTSMHAVWVATVFTEDGERLFSRRGEGDYSAELDEGKLWSWYAFFDNEIGLPAPRYPSVPFKVCVRYIATSDTGVKDESPVFCSNVYNPRI